jgi:hypothetical protein
MFKENKYSKIYYKIIEIAKNREFDGYSEIHHIIPKCLGGNDSKENLIKLKAREHYICHLLLSKMIDHDGIKFALHMMTTLNKNQERVYKINSRIYEYIKKLNSEASVNRNNYRVYETGRSKYFDPIEQKYRFIKEGDFIPDYFTKGWNSDFKSDISQKNKNRVYYYHPKTLEVKAFKSDQIIPDGWVKGNPNADTSDLTKIRGTNYYHDPITGEEIRSYNCPNGWIAGRSVIWITDGINNKQHNKYITIPFGYVKGRINKRKVN